MTVLVRRPAASKAAARPRTGTEAPAAQAPGADGDQEDRTFVLPRAALLLSVDEGEPTVHRLAAITGMGRLDDNQLQIARAGVSRHHAVIEGTPDHRDMVLTDDEKRTNRTMMVCCSGSRSPRLVLDL